MRMYWPAILSFLLLAVLAGCGSEQFGTTPQTKTTSASPLTVFKQGSCANHTLIKPAVDILYLVDNSSSTFYLSSEIKNGIKNTVSSISTQFDYRIIGTPLLSSDNDDFQVLAKNPASLSSSFNTKKVTSASQFTFFSNTNLQAGSSEPGTRRIRDFLTAHQSDGLFRQNSYLFIVLVSNGRDTELETQLYPGSPDPTSQNQIYGSRFSELKTLKNYFNSTQFRLFSLTPLTSCKSGWKSSQKSYASMSKDLYQDHTNPTLTDQGAKQWPDNYDLCSSVNTVFASVNATIKQIVVPHTYKYWPITFTNSSFDISKIKVYKSNSTSSAPVQMTSGWQYLENPNYPGPINTRVLPSPGEPTTARHLIEFTGGEITYPECVSVTSTTNLEYFQYIVLDQAAKVDSITVKINGQDINKSTSNGWSYMGFATIPNIKVSHNGYSDQPPAARTGYMIRLNGSSNFYKSGDDVEVYYLPDSI